MKIDTLGMMRQVGKPCDFDFEVKSTRGVYCSKLVYPAYGDISRPTEKSFGRTAFPPNHAAEHAVRGEEPELVRYTHDGREVKRQPKEAMAHRMGPASPGR